MITGISGMSNEIYIIFDAKVKSSLAIH